MKTTIFLGAGASASEGAPMQNKLFLNYFKTIIGKKDDQLSEMNSELKNFFIKMFNIDFNVSEKQLQMVDFPTFEEALGVLDLAEARNESFKDFSNLNIQSGSGKLKRLRLYLTLLMAKTIHDNLFESKKVHSRLVRNLINNGTLLNTVFISTNYDILIDNALANSYPNYDLDYGVDFINFNEPDNWSKPLHNIVPLYKIHGSLNWLYCPTCNNLRLTPKEKGIITLINENQYLENTATCRRCETVYSPIIVPPTFYKDFTNVFLNLVWNKAEQELLNTNHIIFCGYSFPEADMHIKYLIKRIQKNRNNQRIKFSVINNHSGKIDEVKKEEKNRYQRFLGKSVNYTKYSFEEFARNPELVID